jgi:AraC-like DNA-binding protein
MGARKRSVAIRENVPRRQLGADPLFRGLCVSVRKSPYIVDFDVPIRLDHFCFCYWPRPAPRSSEAVDGVFGAAVLLFIPPGQLSSREWKKIGTAIANFQFQPAFLEEVAASLRIDSRRLYQSAVRKLPLDELLESLCRLLLQEATEGCQHGSSFFESLARTLAVALIQRLVPEPPAVRDPRISQAIRFIELHFQEKISLKEMSEAACLSPYHFVRAFSASVGISPHKYMIACRLRYAQRLMITSGSTRLLADIAVEAGFYDEAHLGSHFRRAFGLPPGRWLRQQ